MKEKYCAVKLKEDRCKGCINCMKRCPTEAIRVRDGKARIIYDRCVSCGECIRICPHRAKYAESDSLDRLSDYKYNVALPAPSLLGQFPNIDNPTQIINAFMNIGFDYVYEVARGADLVSRLTREELKTQGVAKPLISSACPVCVELISIRFHSLVDSLTSILPPLEIASKQARIQAMEQTGLKSEEIGVFFISPCPAKNASVKNNIYTSENNINGVISIKDVVVRLNGVKLSEVELKQPLIAGNTAIAWATSGGEVSNLPRIKQLAADGIDNVMSVLRELEDGKLNDIDFVELNACPGGCVGGVFNVENPFVAKSRIYSLRREALASQINLVDTIKYNKQFYLKDTKWDTIDVYKLDKDFNVAFDKMKQADELELTLPALDCGVCGAPSCHAFAEDVTNGIVTLDKCVRSKSNDS